MYLMSIDDLVLDEYFLYEYAKCQLRALMFSKKNYVTTLEDARTRTSKRYKCKMYLHYDYSLKYKILKNIYYKCFSLIKDGINFEEFKSLSLTIIQKEITANKKKAKNRNQFYYDKIQRSIFSSLEDHFALINEYDMKDSIDAFITLKADLKPYLQYRQSTINPIYTPKLINIDWEQIKGNPVFLLNFINIKKDEDGISIVMTSPLNIDDELVHRNFYISFIIQYVYYFYPKEKFKEILKNDNPNINKLIVYYPLKLERKEYKFKDIVGVYQEMEMLKILKVFLEKLFVRTNDTTNCKYCENNIYCYHRTNAKNTTANNMIFKSGENKIKTII